MRDGPEERKKISPAWMVLIAVFLILVVIYLLRLIL